MTDLLHDEDFFTDEGPVAVQLCAQQLARLVSALRDLGNGNAATQMGAIEAFSVVMQEGLGAIATALGELAEAIREHDA
jgi:hypothetical protein